MTVDDEKTTWALRNIPSAILLALIVQLGATVWWAARMDTRLDINDKLFTALLVRIERVESTNQQLLIDMSQAKAEIRVLHRSSPEP
jgi:hypothetical protein